MYKDPFERWAVFSEEPVAHWVALLTGCPGLPYHLHEMLAAAVLYIALYLAVGPVLRGWAPYARLAAPVRAAFAAHVVSEANALLLLALSYPLFGDENLQTLVSWTPYSTFVCSCMAGYFIFDLYYTALWHKHNGWGFAIHAGTSLFVFLQAVRPFMHSYAAPYIWFEASTPFVNINWLATNVPGVVSKKWQTINGVLLIIVFTACRVVPGPINGYYLFREALFHPLENVPYWVVLVVFVCYISLTALNTFWFGKMLVVAFGVITGKSSLPSSAASTAKPEANLPTEPAVEVEALKSEPVKADQAPVKAASEPKAGQKAKPMRPARAVRKRKI